MIPVTTPTTKLMRKIRPQNFVIALYSSRPVLTYRVSIMEQDGKPQSEGNKKEMEIGGGCELHARAW